MATATATKTNSAQSLVVEPGTPEMVQAVSLALAVLRAAKLSRWDDMTSALAAGDEQVIKNLSSIRLSEDQAKLIAEYEPIFAYIRQTRNATKFKPGKPAVPATAKKAAVPAVPATPATPGQKGVTIAVCPVCDRFIFTSSAAPTRCVMKNDCKGKPVKAGIASLK